MKPSKVPVPRLTNNPYDWICIGIGKLIVVITLGWSLIEKKFKKKEKKEAPVIRMKTDYDIMMDESESFYTQD